MILKKECTGMFPTLAIIETRRKRLHLMKNRATFSIWRTWKCARYILEITLSARAQFTLPVHFGKIKQSHAELVFSFFCSCFSVFLLFYLCLYFFILNLMKHKEKKCKQICKLLTSFYFPSSAGRRK